MTASFLCDASVQQWRFRTIVTLLWDSDAIPWLCETTESPQKIFFFPETVEQRTVAAADVDVVAPIGAAAADVVVVVVAADVDVVVAAHSR